MITFFFLIVVVMLLGKYGPFRALGAILKASCYLVKGVLWLTVGLSLLVLLVKIILNG